MSQTIKGPFTKGVFGLSRIVAESAAFQRRTQSSDPKAAEKHIEQWGYTAWETGELAARVVRSERPAAAIWPASRVELTQYAGGDHNYLKGGGSLVWILADGDRFTPEARDESAADFAGWVDEVLQDLRHNAGRDDRLGVKQVGLLMPFAHSPLMDNASYWHVTFLVDWSV